MSKFRAQIMEGLKKPLSQPMAHMSAKDWKKRRINEQLKNFKNCGDILVVVIKLRVMKRCSDYRCIDD
jgi:predicted glycosyltransferase involved in capsule biosynthesis